MTCDAPHILLLDEPTNHLDVDSRQKEALIQAINGFAGAVVIVSHDPHVLELTADRFWLVAEGGVTAYDGNLDEYKALLLGGRKRRLQMILRRCLKNPRYRLSTNVEQRRQPRRNVRRWHPTQASRRGSEKHMEKLAADKARSAENGRS